MTDVRKRNAVVVSGSQTGSPMLFAHGFGCDQSMWRSIAPDFEADHPVVLFDHVGAGSSDLAAFDPQKYASLAGYAGDIVEIVDALDLRDAILVGHSVSAVIGALAVRAEPSRFSALVMVGPSARYIDDGDYRGGFSREDIEELLEQMDANYLGWSHAMAPMIMDNPERPELAGELTNSFCRTDPEIARHFARTTFLSDNREDLADVAVPTLVIQVARDVIAPVEAGEFVHRQLPDSDFVVLDTVGHCPHMSAPAQTSAAIRVFLSSRGLS